MPFIQVTMLEGRTDEQKRALAKKLTEATVETVGTTPDNVRIFIYEVGKEDFSIGGKTAAELGR